MRSATITGSHVTFFRGNLHRKYIPVWKQSYSTPQKAKRAASSWKRNARITQERA